MSDSKRIKSSGKNGSLHAFNLLEASKTGARLIYLDLKLGKDKDFLLSKVLINVVCEFYPES